MPYDDASFDVATSFFVISNLSLETFKKHFVELFRVLVPGGKAILLIETDSSHIRLYTTMGADPATVENKIDKILKNLPKHPTYYASNDWRF